MNFYLSSYRIGEKSAELKRLIPSQSIGYIPNALDFSKVNHERRKAHIAADISRLEELGLTVLLVDLQSFFGKQGELRSLLEKLGAIFISGGNVFILRQAMRLSGLDEILTEMKDGGNFLYAGYSAAGCVLSSDLEPYAIVDDPTDTPYPELREAIRTGLGFFDFAFMPHWNSDHNESDDINKEIAFCEKHSIPYRTVQDGEVIIIEE